MKTRNLKGKFSAFLLLAIALLSFQIGACGNDTPDSDCPLPYPFCGGSFPLNTQQTTAYGPAWADVLTSPDNWITCFGSYALCFYAQCDTSELTDDGSVVNCPCFQAFGTNFVDINSILNDDVYNETVEFCQNDPDACKLPNQAPVCQSLNSGTFMAGATTYSTFSFYLSTQEPIGTTDCTQDPGLYAGCMTAPCFGEGVTNADGTTTIDCQCPTYDGPFQLGKDNLACDITPLISSAAYNTMQAPTNNCSLIDGCVPDAPPENCGCGLYVPGVTTLPPDSGVDCTKVCQEYNTCLRPNTNIQLGYTCDATLCTSENQNFVADACVGLQNCDISEIFKAESAAECSCCASQLCGCDANTVTDAKITQLNDLQRQAGETPQCDINDTLCGLQ